MLSQILNLPFTILENILWYWFPKYLVQTRQRYRMFLNGITTNSVKISSNVTLSYMERNGTKQDSPVVLLIHGFTSSKEQYIPLCSSLPKKYHVLAFDLPGHGKTICDINEEFSIPYYVQKVKKFVDVLGVSKNKFHIIGISLGGGIAGMYAITYPDDIISTTLFCPRGIKNVTNDKQIEIFRKLGRKYIRFTQSFDEFKAYLNGYILYKKVNAQNLILQGMLLLKNEKREFHIRVGEKLLLEGDPNLLEQNIDKLAAPLMLVWGKEDQILDVSCVDTIKAKLPVQPKKMTVLEECGHNIFLDQPKISQKLVIEFLGLF